MKMKAINGNAPVLQLAIFIITVIYFLVFSQGYIRAEASRCAKEVVIDSQQHIIEKGEQRTQDIQEIKINLKGLCQKMGVEYID